MLQFGIPDLAVCITGATDHKLLNICRAFFAALLTSCVSSPIVYLEMSVLYSELGVASS